MKIIETLVAIHNPRFSTGEMETSSLNVGFEFEITGMYYDDEEKGFPSHALGVIYTPVSHKPIQAHWDRNGKCTIAGQKCKSFDLHRPTQQYIDSCRAFGESLLVGAIVIIICIIF